MYNIILTQHNFLPAEGLTKYILPIGSRAIRTRPNMFPGRLLQLLVSSCQVYFDGISWYRRDLASGSALFSSNHAVRVVLGGPIPMIAPRALSSLKTTGSCSGRCTARRSTWGHIPCISKPKIRQSDSLAPMYRPSTYSFISSRISNRAVVVVDDAWLGCVV